MSAKHTIPTTRESAPDLSSEVCFQARWSGPIPTHSGPLPNAAASLIAEPSLEPNALSPSIGSVFTANVSIVEIVVGDVVWVVGLSLERQPPNQLQAHLLDPGPLYRGCFLDEEDGPKFGFQFFKGHAVTSRTKDVGNVRFPPKADIHPVRFPVRSSAPQRIPHGLQPRVGL